MSRTVFGSVAAAAMVMALAATPLAAQATTAPAPTQISDFKIATTVDGMLSVSGKLAATDPAVTVPAGEPLTIEYARDDHTHWAALPLAQGQTPLKTQSGGAFSGSKYYIGWPHGYYRIRFAGDSALAASLSSEARDTRVAVGVGGWKVSPHKVRKNGYVTFSGTLVERPGASWKPFPGQLVYIVGRIKGDDKWYWYARPKTDSKGHFKARFRVSKSTYWVYVYQGNSTHYIAGTNKTTLVTVR